MPDSLNSLHTAVVDWATDAAARGWLPDDAPAALDDTVLATPGALFGAGERPLVAALFGGTGVGKSTLMNRLAREPVARASAERPTSRDITVYAHRGTPVEGLAATLPMERVRTTLHANDAWRDVLWLDMPDVDSVERANRELVLEWLPHVDALLYVVSPERYRDDEGWRLLLEHGANHAWLFVVNHWDRGDERQIEDFRAMLVDAGLDAPMIFRTDSGPVAADGDGVPDDFTELEATLAGLADRRVVEQLEARGVLQRVAALRTRSEALHARLGDAAALTRLPEAWRDDWTREAQALDEALGWRIAPLAEALVERAPARGLSPLARLGLGGGSRDATPTPPPAPTLPMPSASPSSAPPHAAPMAATQTPPARPTPARATTAPASLARAPTLFDADALARVDDAIERFAQRAADAGTVPLGVARRCLAPARETLAGRLPQLVDDALARSLAEPGTRWQRLAHRAFGALAAILPLAAMLWIGWRVLDAFRDGAINPAAYLGSNFAINGALLLALAWLLPLFLQRKLRPSRERAAARGLRAGLERALEETRVLVAEALDGLVAERQALDDAHAALWAGTADAAPGDPLPDRVRRLLFDGAPRDVQRSAGVRASTQSSTAAAPVS